MEREREREIHMIPKNWQGIKIKVKGKQQNITACNEKESLL